MTAGDELRGRFRASASAASDDDETSLRAIVEGDTDLAWQVLQDVVADAPDEDFIWRLAWGPAAAYIQVGGQEAITELSRAVGRDPKLDYLIFESIDDALGGYRAYQIMGREHTAQSYVRWALEKDEWQFWSFSAVCAVQQENPYELWRVILDLVAAAPNDAALAVIGAGPVEEFIRDSSFTNAERAEAVKRIEVEAFRDPRFRAALSNVWIWGDVSTAIFDRVERAAGAPLARPKS